MKRFIRYPPGCNPRRRGTYLRWKPQCAKERFRCFLPEDGPPLFQYMRLENSVLAPVPLNIWGLEEIVDIVLPSGIIPIPFGTVNFIQQARPRDGVASAGYPALNQLEGFAAIEG